jgi:hypothetical protein
LTKSLSYLGRLRFPLELVDLPLISDRLAVNGVLEPFGHRFEMPKAILQILDTLRHRQVLSGSGRSAGWLSARAQSNRDAFERRW